MGIFKSNKRPDINEGVKRFMNTADAVLLDVRTEEEYLMGHIPKSLNIPLRMIEDVEDTVENKSTALYVYCRSGARSRQAVDMLEEMGYTNAVNIGGIIPAVVCIYLLFKADTDYERLRALIGSLMLIALAADREMIPFETGIKASYGILAISSWIGYLIGAGKGKKLVAGMLTLAAYFLVLLCANILMFKGSFHDVITTLISVLVGAVGGILMKFIGKGKSPWKRRKMAYR